MKFEWIQIWDKIKKVYVPVWSYSVLIYGCAAIIDNELFTALNCIKTVFPFSFSSNWYASAYIIFLFSVPILNDVVEKLSKREHQMACVLSVFLWSIVPTITGNAIVTALNHATNIVWFSTCFIIAAYIKKYVNYNDKRLIFWGVITSIACYALFALSIYLIDYKGIVLGLGTASSSVYLMQINYIPVALCAFALFFVFVNIRFSSAIVNKVAGLTFGVYLIHDNYYIKRFLWQKICRSVECFNGEYFYLKALAGIAFIFLICSVIEVCREFITKRVFRMLWNRRGTK